MEEINQFFINTYEFWSCITALASLGMAIGVIYAARAYRSSQRNNQLHIIEKCSDEYRRYMQLLQRGQFTADTKRDLLGLFHKQLYYIEDGFLPNEIKKEWLKTMYSILMDDRLFIKYGKNYMYSLKYTDKDWESFERIKDFAELLQKNTRKAKKIKKLLTHAGISL